MAQAGLELTLCPQIYNPLQACATTIVCYCLCVALGTKPLYILGKHPATTSHPQLLFLFSGKILLVLFLVVLIEPVACACCVSTSSLSYCPSAAFDLEKGFH